MTRKYRQLNPMMVQTASALIILVVLAAVAMPGGDARRILLGVALAAAVLLLMLCTSVGSSQAKGVTDQLTMVMIDQRATEEQTQATLARLTDVEALFADHVSDCPCDVPPELERALRRIPSNRSA